MLAGAADEDLVHHVSPASHCGGEMATVLGRAISECVGEDPAELLQLAERFGDGLGDGLVV